MAEPIIHVIPAGYWGGASPKKAPLKQAVGSGLIADALPEALKPARKLSPAVLFFMVAGGLFVAVVSGAIWYFTRGLRVPAPAPTAPPEAPAELAPLLPAPPEIPESPAEVEPPPLPSLPPPPSPPSLAQDADSDGLSEAEEPIYHSQPTIPDTDNDGFLDGHEVFHLYNPSGIAPERLEAAGLALRHKNEAMGYEVLFPARWRIIPSTPDERTLLFTPSEGGGIEITAMENLGGLTLPGWLEAQQPGTVTAWSANKSGLEGYVGSDGMTFYFAGGARIFELKYTPEGGVGPYKRTLEMMANSFKIM